MALLAPTTNSPLADVTRKLKFQAKVHLLGILLMARRGLRTRIVLIADRFMFSTFKQYSKALIESIFFSNFANR